MNRVNPVLFSAAFTGWVRFTWPTRPDLVAIDGKTNRRSHDRATGTPLHLISAFATTARLVLGQEAVPGKAGEATAIPALIARLSGKDGLKGALISIDAIAANPAIATTIRSAGADYILVVKANQPTLRAEVEAVFADDGNGAIETHVEHDKGHGRIEERSVGVAREVDWLDGPSRCTARTSSLPGVTTNGLLHVVEPAVGPSSTGCCVLVLRLNPAGTSFKGLALYLTHDPSAETTNRSRMSGRCGSGPCATGPTSSAGSGSA